MSDDEHLAAGYLTIRQLPGDRHWVDSRDRLDRPQYRRVTQGNRRLPENRANIVPGHRVQGLENDLGIAECEPGVQALAVEDVVVGQNQELLRVVHTELAQSQIAGPDEKAGADTRTLTAAD